MCGIAGIVQEPPEPIDVALLRAMTDTLTHRGPDGDGYFVDPGVGLGHRRLSIIDLAGGSQPMFNEDRTLAVVFNGEIYNYVELRAELGARHRLATSSDTEALVHLYEDLGADCVRPLNGMFCFAIWDSKERRLFIARDRLGEKPLYYYQHGGQLVFASELKALLKSPLVPREVDPAALDDYLAYGYVPGERCIIRGVRKLPPGHRLLWRRGHATVEPYWDVRLSADNAESDADRIAHLGLLMRDAVRMRLRSDVPLGVFLSGGIDSSTVAALAAEVAGSPIKTFSVGFDEADFDELAFARQTAQKLGADHHEITTRMDDVDVLPELAYHLDEPFADPSALPTYYICREARRYVTVCLSGDGGDELFAGYRRYRDAAAYAAVDVIPRGIRRTTFGALAAMLPAHVYGKGFLGRLAADERQRYQSLIATFGPAERRQLFRPELRTHVRAEAWLIEPYLGDGAGSDLVARLQHADQKTYLPDDILVKVDRMSMRHSLEVRVPFLDHTVVEYVNTWPTSAKLRDGENKYLLKRMIVGLVPADTLERSKKGFGIPIRRWFRGGLAEYPQELLLSPSSRLLHWLDGAAVRAVLDAHQRGMRDFSKRIWALLVLEHWCRAYGL